MGIDDWLDSRGLFLAPPGPLPLDRPFRSTDADALGVSRWALAELVRRGVVRRVLRGVYAAAQAPDSVLLRAHALRLVLPAHAVVTDRTAAWLHGVPVLRRGAHLHAPPLDVCQSVDSRVRRPEVDGRRRQLRRTDVVEVHGVVVTTPLRTATDLGRLLWRYDAMAALDGFLRLGVGHEDLLEEVERFRGFRGVRQLRAYAPLADGAAESPGESALRLRWHEAMLPRPDLQIWVADPGGPSYRIDLGVEALLLGAEYDGELHHSAPADREHDRVRRGRLAEQGWLLGVFDKNDVYAPGRAIEGRLQALFSAVRRRAPRWTP